MGSFAILIPNSVVHCHVSSFMLIFLYFKFWKQKVQISDIQTIRFQQILTALT